MDASNVGQPEPGMQDLEFYDHERIAINRVLTALSANVGQHRSLERFRAEVQERFAEIGFLADVVFYEATPEGGGDPYIHPEVTIKARLNPESEFDHARQAHEVQSNILGVRDHPGRAKSAPVSMHGTRRPSGLIIPKGAATE